MDWQTIGGLVARHTLTTAGGWLAAHGYLASDGVSGFVGAGMIVLGIAASARSWSPPGRASATSCPPGDRGVTRDAAGIRIAA
jgi:hypothetical protein